MEGAGGRVAVETTGGALERSAGRPADPHKGLDLILKRRPQIVICDLMMPGMTGMEMLSEIVRVDPVTDVLLLTAHYSTESAVEAIQKGASDYLTKPLDTRKLRSRVDELIQNVRRRMTVRHLDSELLQQLPVPRDDRPQRPHARGLCPDSKNCSPLPDRPAHRSNWIRERIGRPCAT